MAIVLCVTCGIFCWLGVWVLLGGEARRKEVLEARLHTIENLLRRLIAMSASGVFAHRLHAWRPLSEAGKDLSVALRNLDRPLNENESESIILLSLLASSVIGFLLARSIVGAIIIPSVFLVVLSMRHAARLRSRTKCLAEEMPGVLRTMANALESGQTLVQAVEYVGLHESGPAAESFTRTSLRLRCGMSVESALDELSHELEAPGVGLMVTALMISQRTGSPLRDLLRRSASLVEQQGEFERLLSVRTAQVRLSVRIVCGMPVVMVCLMAMISPDFRLGVVSVPGVTCLLLSAIMDGLALMLIRKIMGGVL